MAHFNFVISQNAKWGHAGFYIDCHRITVPENILLQKKHWLQAYLNQNSTVAHKCQPSSKDQEYIYYFNNSEHLL